MASPENYSYVNQANEITRIITEANDSFKTSYYGNRKYIQIDHGKLLINENFNNKLDELNSIILKIMNVLPKNSVAAVQLLSSYMTYQSNLKKEIPIAVAKPVQINKPVSPQEKIKLIVKEFEEQLEIMINQTFKEEVIRINLNNFLIRGYNLNTANQMANEVYENVKEVLKNQKPNITIALINALKEFMANKDRSNFKEIFDRTLDQATEPSLENRVDPLSASMTIAIIKILDSETLKKLLE